MLNVNNITLRFGEKILLDQASLRLDTGMKLGLIGQNGAGKTSFLKLITKELEEDQGEIFIPAAWKIAYLKQELPQTTQSAFEYTQAGDTEWVAIQATLREAEALHDGIKMAEAYATLDVIDGYRIEARTAIILKGLGFTEANWNNPVSSFSGGWQMRLQLAHILMARSDILLLDEPTNHLDLETILWLETWLNNYNGTTIIISHDRAFLDHITSHTITLSHKKLKLYQGNYSSYARQFQQALILQEKSNKKIIKQQQHLQSFVNRFKAKATKAKQAQSRIKAIEKLSISSEFQQERSLSFSFFDATATGYPAITVNANLGYNDTTILKSVNLTLGDGDRIGVIGKNGSGKSTLLKTIAQQLPIINGSITYHPKLSIGYFSQQQVDMLDLERSPLDHLTQQDKQVTESIARSYLGGFGYSNDEVFSPVHLFSGGEKARLALALIIWQKPNILILDEPTNHLDMSIREAFIIALQAFTGALILVSHDRYFIECCANDLWLVNDGKVTTFHGNLNDYQQLQRETMVVNDASKTSSSQPLSKKTTEKALEKKLKAIEREIKKLHTQLSAIETQLADPELYQNPTKEQLDLSKKLQEQQRSISNNIDAKEQEWLDLSE